MNFPSITQSTVTIIPAESGWFVSPRRSATMRVIAWQVIACGEGEAAHVVVKAITVDGPTTARAVYGPSKTQALCAMGVLP